MSRRTVVSHQGIMYEKSWLAADMWRHGHASLAREHGQVASRQSGMKVLTTKMAQSSDKTRLNESH